MGIKIRHRTLKSGNVIVYLDIHNQGQRQTKNLSLIDRKAIAGKIRKDNRNKTEEEIQDRTEREIQKVLKEELKSAEIVKAKLNIEIFESGLINLADNSDITFSDYLKRHLQKYNNRHSIHTINTAVKIFNLFLNNKPIKLKQINREIISDFKLFIDKLPYKSESKITIFKRFKTIIRAAYNEELIPQNYAAKVPGFASKQSKIEYLTFEEVQTLFNYQPRHEVLRIFLFGCFTGLRISDLLNLKYKDIKDGAIYITQGKTRETVFIPLHENALTLINPDQTDPDSYIFDIRSIQQNHRDLLKALFKKAGINKRAFFHLSRHTFATLSLSFGADLYTVSKLLGHTEISVTQRYAKVIDENKKKAISLIPTINK